MPQKETKSKDAGKRRIKQNSNHTFLAKSREAALQQSKVHMEKQKNRSFFQINEEEMSKSPRIEVITQSDSTQNSPIKVFTSNKKFDIHQTQPSQAGMLSLGNLVRFSCIHRCLTSKAQAWKEFTKQGKNLKPILQKQNLGKLPLLSEPNEELQMHFAGPIPFKNHIDNYYILVSVDRYSRFPTAEVYKDCDASTGIEFLEEYCRLHDIPRSIRCDQAKAFKSRDFNVYCKDNNIKLILAPARDHRATGMVGRLIQIIKRKLGVMTIDPLLSSGDKSTIIANIIQSIRLIPNRITKIAPIEAHFGRKPNTAQSNIVTKPNKQNLSYKQLKNFASDRRFLKQPVLSPAAIWDIDQDSEPEPNIQYREAAQKEPKSCKQHGYRKR